MEIIMELDGTLSKEKQELIKTILQEAAGKNQKEIIPFLLAASMQASKKGIIFTDEETQTIFSALKEGKTPEEQKRLDMVMKMAGTLAKKQFNR